MKNAYSHLLITAFAVVSMLACQPKNDSGGGGEGGTVASTPTVSCNIYGNTSCNPGQYQQFGTQFITYNGTYNSGRFCGCPAGYRPIMMTEWGLNCAPDIYFPQQNAFQFYGYHYSQVAWASQNNHWTSVQQDIYRPANQVNNCYDYAAAACDTRLNQSNGTNPHCGAMGGTCQQSAGGSSLGFCANQQYNNGWGYGYGYGQQPGCQRYMGRYGWVQVCGHNGYNSGGGQPR